MVSCSVREAAGAAPSLLSSQSSGSCFLREMRNQVAKTKKMILVLCVLKSQSETKNKQLGGGEGKGPE